jgi:hypothetical protein
MSIEHGRRRPAGELYSTGVEAEWALERTRRVGARKLTALYAKGL